MHVLIVEDEERLAALLQRGLMRENYAVTVAHNGIDGLWHAQETSFDVVVLDVMLPGMNGLEVCRQMRAESIWSPVLLLTARGRIEDRVDGLDAGADDYLMKPFAFDELTARLRALLRRGSTERPTSLTVGNLVIDPASREATTPFGRADLTAREFALVELFARSPGQVLSRDQMLEHAWDFASLPASNVIEQHIASARRKLDEVSSTAEIVTVRGVGYRMVAAD
ncbi:DNA-binding response regulator [Flexivirga endophytica]|uniref:DNA-binding response regulator n=1 Tax=Flexivirga endophytica TaxID=1849103 RepID=A0A916T668_9MICO|nr:response regulator transcription factor [Flexivirga endophytica]GGB31330.1 DNA-binding response regulator [Flexivirga endophytica]GHB52277.1 DNA-binding response regulator [Flexivirga endophytica]